MRLSKELQIGKAGEHFVCYDLLMQGYAAFLADQGMPFDIVLELNGELKRIQVRSTQKEITYAHAKEVYRFSTRRGNCNAKDRKNNRAIQAEVDYFAFVALDIMRIAYIPISIMFAKTGLIKQTIDLKKEHFDHYKSIGSNEISPYRNKIYFIVTPEIVREIRSIYTGKRGEIVMFAKQFGITEASVSNIVHFRTWKNVT